MDGGDRALPATVSGVERSGGRGDPPVRRGRARLPHRPATHPLRPPRRVRSGARHPPARRDAPRERRGHRRCKSRRSQSLRQDHRAPPTERFAVPLGGGADLRGGDRVRGVDRR